ncbi:hypothetical protein L873DRAFT_1836523 [Choiromyces venosus 120613-1]|uniref:Tc1-like transposase DDE domain-containing protein n=1 Tax=Choiromyces venosus 120613-1 TaxID=1336337 RepID=A0A3N4JFS2_9PEZI|nr:hypothetical protein L873DRAFT_1836523 [Choiromyces venosus 120613-1]
MDNKPIQRVLWSDESSFSTTGFGHRPWVIRKADEEYHPDCIYETFWQGRKSKMVRGAFCGITKSDLVFIPGKAILDSATYEYHWAKVVEDGTPGHQKYAIKYQKLNEMDTIKWPLQSLDLNLIESFWLDMETELGEIWGRIVWGTIEGDRMESLIRSMPTRLQAVIDANGGAILY